MAQPSSKSKEAVQAAAAKLPSLSFGKKSGLVSVAQEASTKESLQIFIEDLVDSPFQPRLQYDEGDLLALGTSLLKRQIEPILVRRIEGESNKYELLSGHRRKRAGALVGITKLDAKVLDVSDAEARILVLAANEPREEFSDFERALAYRAILDDGLVKTHALLAEWIGVDRSLVSHRLKMLELPAEVTEVLRTYPRAFSHRWVAKILEVTALPHYQAGRLQDLIRQVAAKEIDMADIFRFFAEPTKKSASAESDRLAVSLRRDNKVFASITANPVKRQVMVKIPGAVDVEEMAKLIQEAIESRYSAKAA